MKGKLASVRQKVYSSKTNQFQKRTALIIQNAVFGALSRATFQNQEVFLQNCQSTGRSLRTFFFPFIRPSLVCKRRHYSTCRLAVYCCLAMWACPLLVVAVVCVVCVCVSTLQYSLYCVYICLAMCCAVHLVLISCWACAHTSSGTFFFLLFRWPACATGSAQ